jgi:uncharacterized protein (DUF1778 family)
MTTAIKEQTRFDTRLPKQQKEFFEKASVLGGYRNLSDFIIQAAQEKAKEIILEREQIIASEKDSEVFFNAIMNPPSPNESLRNAAERYKSHFPE